MAVATPEEKEHLYKRRASDALYRQTTSSEGWQRYVTLGYFAVHDGKLFDQEWNRFEAVPVWIYKLIWYNYLHHIDRDMDIPPNFLSAYATQASQQLLQQHDPDSLQMETLCHTRPHNLPLAHTEIKKWMTPLLISK
jgi:hypothetical protein